MGAKYTASLSVGNVMLDLHCHLLPGIDDGASSLEASLAMARALADDGATIVACTPHILPGVFHNTGPQIKAAVKSLQGSLSEAGITLYLVSGADNHMVPDFVSGLRSGHLLPLGDSRYVLVEPPHHVAPNHLEKFFFDLQLAGYVPILTHPERLAWIKSHYAAIERLARAGVWMQITSGSLSGRFGSTAQYWAERMLDEGYVHILASDAHDVRKRPPDLGRGREIAARRVGLEEAEHLVFTRPRGAIVNALPSELPQIPALERRPNGASGIARDSRAGVSAVGRLWGQPHE